MTKIVIESLRKLWGFNSMGKYERLNFDFATHKVFQYV